MSLSVADPGDDRARHLAHALRRLKDRVAAACAGSGRAPTELTVIAVTKTYPVDDVRRLADLGVQDFGENRIEELVEKGSTLASMRWHYLGRIQSRQTADIAARAAVVHSVDRAKVARRLGRAAVGVGRRIDALVQVSFDGDPRRGGVPEDEVPALADEVAGTAGLRLAGVMGVPPLGADPAAAYRRLAALAATLRRSHPDATWVSAGMSGDLEAAVAAGATHLRIGTALLGRRASPVG